MESKQNFLVRSMIHGYYDYSIPLYYTMLQDDCIWGKKYFRRFWDPNPHPQPREEDILEPQTTQPSNEMMVLANFLVHNPRGSAIFRWNSTHSRPQILWVRESWSLPLNLKLLSDVYFHIKSKKLAPLVLFLSHETCEKKLSTFSSK